MAVVRGDFVRAINPKPGLPASSVWLVVRASGAFTLEPFSATAKSYPGMWRGKMFSPADFEKVVPVRDGWQACTVETDWMADNDAAVRKFLAQPTAPSAPATDVDKAEVQLEAATDSTARRQALLQEARDLEVKRKAELRDAKVAQAKADKEAAAKAKVVEAKRQLAARLHADSCLADATRSLIGEVGRLNGDGPEREAPPGIAMHADQLQPLAKSYGYRIVKPSLIAIVVKL